VRLGIDASNLRGGGGVTHLSELLAHADPRAAGFERVTVWSGARTLQLLPARPWLTLAGDPELEGGLRGRVAWQRHRLSTLARESCDVLFVPGGTYGGDFHPYVTMSQNMLPFDLRESARYGVSWMMIRLLLLRVAQRRSFNRADGMAYLNDYARSRIGSGRRTAVIAHGISERFFRQPKPQRAIGDYSFDHPFTILYTSIVDVYKHQWNVAEAVLRLRAEGLPVRLMLAGGAYPPSMKRLERVVARDRETAITLLGEVPHADIVRLYHEADAFVFASTCENMPNILLEAMAAGLPIACSSKPPMPQLLGNDGIYFDPLRVDDIGRALRELIADPQSRAQLAAGAFEHARAYSWERCARETFAFLASVAEGRA